MQIAVFRFAQKLFFALGLSSIWNGIVVPYGMSSEALRAIPRSKSCVFQIVGVPRSGTTLLATRFDGHPNITCLVEPYLSWLQRGYFEYDGGVNDLNYHEKYNKPPHFLIEHLCHHSSSKFIGFKETFRAGEENPLFPPTKSFLVRNEREKCVDATIAIVRDPRDVWASAIEVARHSGLDICFDQSIPNWNICSQWIVNDSVFYVRYEDLVLKSEQVWRSIAAHLGFEFCPDMLVTQGKKGAGDKRAQQGGRVFTSSVGRYRDDLPAQDQEYIHNHCGVLMERFGYV
jgi:hypothetical protein